MSSCSIIEELYTVILDRIEKRPEGSYTASLVSRGREYVVRKFGEEAVETMVAALSESRERLISEIADLVYHLLVVMALNNVKPEDIYRELARRRR